MVSQMVATPIHGQVSQLGRAHQVSRQTLYRWAATGRQEQGISRLSTVSDGGRAIQEAVSQVHGEEQHQRDVWHLFWPFIALSRLGCSLCSRFGIITGLLLVVFMRGFLPYNGRKLPRPLIIGWRLWAILLSLPDCSKVSHDFEPCLNIH
jgi:hypothetical protein